MEYFVWKLSGKLYRKLEKYTGIWLDKYMQYFVGNLSGK